MFSLFGIHNVLQEAIMQMPDFKYGVMLGYVEVCGMTLFSFFRETIYDQGDRA